MACIHVGDQIIICFTFTYAWNLDREGQDGKGMFDLDIFLGLYLDFSFSSLLNPNTSLENLLNAIIGERSNNQHEICLYLVSHNLLSTIRNIDYDVLFKHNA